MVTITEYNLRKIEDLCKALGYKVRYEKGSFRTGACKILSTKVIVVNRFSSLDVKIHSLIEIITGLEIDESLLDEKQKVFFRLLKQTKLTI